MQRAIGLYQTTIGKKAVMAVSGVILFGFTVGHLAGNMNAYKGPLAFNEYANFLRTMMPLLWTARILLLFAVSAHIYSAFELWSRNKAARPTRYQKKVDVATYYAAKTMYWSGPVLLFYILYHLMHLTFGQTMGLYEFDPTNPYNNLILGFQHWAVAAVYIVGNLALGVHLFHGLWSMFQSLGANHPKYNAYRRWLAIGGAVLITAGNLSFPIMTMAGVLEPTSETFDFPHLR